MSITRRYKVAEKGRVKTDDKGRSRAQNVLESDDVIYERRVARSPPVYLPYTGSNPIGLESFPGSPYDPVARVYQAEHHNDYNFASSSYEYAIGHITKARSFAVVRCRMM